MVVAIINLTPNYENGVRKLWFLYHKCSKPNSFCIVHDLGALKVVSKIHVIGSLQVNDLFIGVLPLKWT